MAGWIAVCGQVSQFGIYPVTQVNSDWPYFRGQAQRILAKTERKQAHRVMQ